MLIPVHKFHEGLQTPETASAEAEAAFDEGVVLVVLLQLVVHVFNHRPDNPNDGYDQGAKGQRPQVIKQRPPKAGEKWELPQFGFVPGEVQIWSLTQF